MLKPYVCVACEKVILSEHRTPSLINLFDKVSATIQAEAPEIPKNAVTPKEWAVFSSWETEPGDDQKEYFVCTHILYPDQTPFGDVNKTKVNVERDKRSQVGIQMLGFPIGQSGSYTVKTWVEENQKIVVAPIEFKIELEIIKQTQAPKA